MEEICAYHMTSKSNIRSILLNGLVPDIGINSRGVKEHSLLTYFTTLDCIDTWIERFNLNRNDTVILRFSCGNYVKRMDSANDYFTSEVIDADSIMVISDDDISLSDYYNDNKEVIDLEANKKVTTQIKQVVDRLEEISNTELIPEDGWDYNEVDPDLVSTIDILKKIRSLDNKGDYADILKNIRMHTLDKLVANDLGVTEESELYKSVNELFSDAMLDNPKITLLEMNCFMVAMEVNLLYRQLDRYNRTGKKYEDNAGWRFDMIDSMNIPKGNVCLDKLVDDTKTLYESSKKRQI